MKAALEAWGADSNLFHQGKAKESDDPAVIAATMKKPGVVLRRPVGSDGPFSEHAELPTDLVDLTTSSDDAEESKPAPDIFEVVLRKLQIEGPTPWRSATRPTIPLRQGKAKIATIGVLCGGFTESLLQQAGCVEVYPGPAAILACFGDSLLAR